MDLGQLRVETRPEHEATEATMPLMAPDLSLSTYVGVLRRLLPVIAGWERWAASHAPERMQPLLAERRRSPLLVQDLHCLAAQEPEFEPVEPISWDRIVAGSAGKEETSFAAAFLGMLYVVEGSTLGGRFIARHVEESLKLQPGCGNAYFQGYGEATGRMWREVMALLTALPEQHTEEVIAAAKRTFQAFGRALEGVAAVGVASLDAETADPSRTPVQQSAS